MIQFYSEKQGGVVVAIFRATEQGEKLDAYISRFVGHELHNVFVDRGLNNPNIRVVIKGLNDLAQHPISSITGHPEVSLRGSQFRKGFMNVVILWGGMGLPQPTRVMDDIVNEYFSRYDHYVESHLDNPYLRVLVQIANTAHWVEYDNQVLSQL